MLTEFNLFGVFIAPLAVYALAALPLTMVVRSALWWTGLQNWFWHVALFEVSLYVCILCLLVLYV
ncbi:MULTISPECIES: DUF1656 domain-containing protein [Acetobacter]|uniref:DUF1656 domain-containing protein n=1 Tax=Acetobacter thailandicus TaxID=1502842 RepID=A0ABT3QCG2_9PROT|nr:MULTISPECIES: DUF1656 domain-containing protein [Acetobacter]MBS0961022.1 DUF1656 domain-containing protein [Acetobacter thailandicus]MBS0986483.1 DUF1656 domain-containing protein [Acetobacter thailandicus]MBS1003970.1 DUF1656 domain-containing protein [Acetobacter thailandicus]MCX2562977.1 DUF1656 domain-containing protein [Acetobacter thailandicus]NHN95619.1 DUF1656 domain-containing protein [Acetobacter thailandicus]